MSDYLSEKNNAVYNEVHFPVVMYQKEQTSLYSDLYNAFITVIFNCKLIL